VREQQVFSAVMPCTASVEGFGSWSRQGYLSGGRVPLHDKDAPVCDPAVWSREFPCWEFVMGCSGWRRIWVEKWSRSSGGIRPQHFNMEKVESHIWADCRKIEDLGEPRDNVLELPPGFHFTSG